MELSIHDIKKISVSKTRANLKDTRVRSIVIENMSGEEFRLILFGIEKNLKIIKIK